MTREEKNFFQLLTTEIGVSITFKHSSILIGNGELEEQIEIPISSYEDFDLIKDLREPLKDRLSDMLDDIFIPNDEIILTAIYNKL